MKIENSKRVFLINKTTTTKPSTLKEPVIWINLCQIKKKKLDDTNSIRNEWEYEHCFFKKSQFYSNTFMFVPSTVIVSPFYR